MNFIKDKILFIYEWDWVKAKNVKGYVTTLEDNRIIFGDRNLKNITNSLTANYNFSALSGIALAFRHYWAPISYGDQFYSLQEDGTLENTNYQENEDVNFNIWNMVRRKRRFS